MVYIKNLKLIFEKKYRAIVLGTVFFGIFLIVFLGAEAYFSYKLELEKIANSTKNYAYNLEENLNSNFLITSRELDYLSEKIKDSLEVNKHFSSIQLKQLIGKRPEILNSVDSIRFYDIKGNILANSEDRGTKFNVADRAYFQQALGSINNELIVSAPIISRYTRKWVLVLCKVVKNDKGDKIGVLSAVIDIEKIKSILKNITITPQDLVSFYTLDGINVARFPEVAGLTGTKIYQLNRENDWDESNLFNYYQEEKSPIDNQNRFVSRIKLRDFNFFVSLGTHKKNALAAWQERTVTHLAIISFILIGFSFFLLTHLISLELLDHERKMTLQSAKLSAVGEMAAGIAHEINNPLTIIQGLLANLRKQLEAESSIDLNLYNKKLDKINSTIFRITKIMKGLRNFTRDSFNDPFEKKNLGELFEEAMDLTAERLRSNNVELIANNIDRNIEIDCREIQITQVIVNLINNAYDAISQSDKKWIEIQGSVKNETYVIKIIDSGNGISSEILDKIMEPFYTTKSLGKGTGLGLSISKSIIESHRGKLYVDTFAKNTSLVVELPINQKAA